MSEHSGLSHHEREFGIVKGGLVNIDGDAGCHLESGSSTSMTAGRARNLRRRMFKRRYLKQYFLGNVLYRTEHPRPITTDELFLDLIIVANTAAIGHDLRLNFKGWRECENFLLLFLAISNIWHTTSLFWNLFGTERDMNDKLFVGLMFLLLTMIGVGAHEAFGKALPFVGAGAFLGILVPTFLVGYFSRREALLSGKHNVVNHGVLYSYVHGLTALPYLAAMFVSSERVSKILFWIPPGLQVFSSFITVELFRWLHRSSERKEKRASYAVHIELMIEKYQVLTLIVLGESLIAVLHEAASLISKDDARISILYGATAGATIIVGGFQMLYVDTDNYIMKQSTHAIRYNVFCGQIWSTIHVLYNACLVLFAAGLGIMFRDIITPKATEKIDRIVVQASAPAQASAGPEFGVRSRERWLFSCSWAGALLLSGVLSMTHEKGPRERTKVVRLAVRIALVIGLGVGMPLSDVSAGIYLLAHTLVMLVISNVEFWLVAADSVNLLRNSTRVSEHGGENLDNFEDELQYVDDDDTDENETPQCLKGIQGDQKEFASPDPEAVEERMNECTSTRAVQRRMKTRNKRHRMVKVHFHRFNGNEFT